MKTKRSTDTIVIPDGDGIIGPDIPGGNISPDDLPPKADPSWIKPGI